jgi:dihydrodipicolinate synthase/N-acetylneuraminate lyase
MLLEGLHIPLTTPFHPDGRLNPHKLASNVARYSKTPAAGLIVLGPSGEPTLLSDDEVREALRTAVQSASLEKVLIAAISRDSVHATLALADFAAEENYDALLIGIPSMFAVDAKPRETLTYFLTVADRSPIPIVLLSANRRAIPIDTIVELAAHPQIIGLFSADSKQSQSATIAEILSRTAAIRREVNVTPTFAAVTSRMEIAAEASQRAARASILISAGTLAGAATAIAEPPTMSRPVRTRTRTVGFQIIAADTAAVLSGLGVGAVGIAPSFAACAPQACYEVFAAWKDNDKPLAEEKQERLNQAAPLAEATPGALKFACDLNGYFGGLPRLPHLPPTGVQRAELESQMKTLRN